MSCSNKVIQKKYSNKITDVPLSYLQKNTCAHNYYQENINVNVSTFIKLTQTLNNTNIVYFF